jgi:hypothetical protein
MAPSWLSASTSSRLSRVCDGSSSVAGHAHLTVTDARLSLTTRLKQEGLRAFALL